MDNNMIIRKLENTIKRLNVVYYAVFMSTILITVVIFTLTYTVGRPQSVSEDTEITLSSILILYMLISIPVTLWFFHKKTIEWKNIDDAGMRIDLYKKGASWRLWIVGTSLIGGVVLTYVLSSYSMMFCAFISAIAIYLSKPTLKKITNDIDIEIEE